MTTIKVMPYTDGLHRQNAAASGDVNAEHDAIHTALKSALDALEAATTALTGATLVVTGLSTTGTFTTGDAELNGALNHDGTTVGFYGTTPISQATGVAVSSAGIHAAIVNLGLFTA